MKNEKDISELFDSLEGKFDIDLPNKGHKTRFKTKLNKINFESTNAVKWKPYLAIAASLFIGFTLFFGLKNSDDRIGLASVSSEYAETHDFFSASIRTELNKIENLRSPFTENIIEDALRQLKTLENDYNNLIIDLETNTNDQRIIYAMISNFQNRIDLLNDVLDKIEDLKKFKTKTNATTTTF